MEDRMGGGNSSEVPSPPPAPVPLVLDDTPMNEMEAEALETMTESIVRHAATRTIFHQPRGDDDTLYVATLTSLRDHQSISDLCAGQELHTVSIRYRCCILIHSWPPLLRRIQYAQ